MLRSLRKTETFYLKVSVYFLEITFIILLFFCNSFLFSQNLNQGIVIYNVHLSKIAEKMPFPIDIKRPLFVDASYKCVFKNESSYFYSSDSNTVIDNLKTKPSYTIEIRKRLLFSL